MTVYLKVDGSWVAATRPYVKINGAWTPVNEVLVKRSGVWVDAFVYDVVPPSSPMISLQIVQTTYGPKNQSAGTHIKLGVRMPEAVNNPEIRLIRVLSTYNGGPPTTQFGQTRTDTPDDNHPNESWSDWEFDGSTRDTSVERFKTWPPSAKDQTVLPANKKYYFTAWAQDVAGNWSRPTATEITSPKDGTFPFVITKETTFTPNVLGSLSSGVYTQGIMRQQVSPFSRGVLTYGNQITAAVGSTATPKIKSAQIYLIRVDQGGEPQANIYISWHGAKNATEIAAGFEYSDRMTLGTMSKGEGKWFTLPDSFLSHLNFGIKGFIFQNVGPWASGGAKDFSVLAAASANIKSGQLHVVWTES